MSTLAERFAELFSERPDIKAIDLARACRVKGPSVAACKNIDDTFVLDVEF